MKKEIIPATTIAQSIQLVRGQRVMLDRDLAALYRVETRALNQAVKRNATRFPPDFAFILSRQEIERISQSVTSSAGLKFSKQVRAFTEQGIAMLSSVLKGNRSGERTRLACWRWRLAIANFALPGGVSDPATHPRKGFSARRRKRHARRVRSPIYSRR